MYARVLKLTLANGKTRADAEAMADQTSGLYKTLKGFVSATYFVYDESKREYGSVTLWETKADADAAAERARANFMERHADKVAGPPDALTVEVYEPK